MERETGIEPATSSLGIQTYFESTSLARFCCEFLNLHRLAESAFSRFDHTKRDTNETSAFSYGLFTSINQGGAVALIKHAHISAKVSCKSIYSDGDTNQ